MWLPQNFRLGGNEMFLRVHLRVFGGISNLINAEVLDEVHGDETGRSGAGIWLIRCGKIGGHSMVIVRFVFSLRDPAGVRAEIGLLLSH